MPPDAPTTAQLKADIDSGRTHDKVAASDPAASPLGTDDEAAGRPASPATIAVAQQTERARPVEPVEKEGRGGNWVWFVVLCALIIVAVVLVARM